jgi:glycosyltransferase involved in cell wall biosynthesis
VTLSGRSSSAVCRLAVRVMGIPESEPEPLCAVESETCAACCQTLAPEGELNPVVASIVYRAAGEIARGGGRSDYSAADARRMQQRAAFHLRFAHPALEGRTFPPMAPPPTGAPNGASRGAARLTWQIGLLTAPRRVPTIRKTLENLNGAGFGPIHVFAEPGSALPRDIENGRLTIHPRRLGNFANFYSSLATLFENNPDADCYAVFQDDILVATGAREWCDREFWPQGAGIVSLFTPQIHGDGQPGWRLKFPGFFHVYGAQALVFRGDLLRRFLADPMVLHTHGLPDHNDDAVVSGWAARHRLPIAYHSPSLVQHVGMVSSIYAVGPDPRVVADAVDSVEKIAAWRRPERPPGKVGLVGWHVANGVGYQNYDIAEHLSPDRWLIPAHPQRSTERPANLSCAIDYVPLDLERQRLRSWLRGLDWVLFVERPCLALLAQIARGQNIGVACIPNWEWLHPKLEWLSYIDLMICPTRRTFAHMSSWKARYGFGWEIIHVPWPVDTMRFQFRERTTCRRFVFVNGWGGSRARRLDGSIVARCRKGVGLIARVAREAPHLPLIVYSQQTQLPELPAHVELRPPPADNRRLYDDGDVCVQPSHYEGLGLQLLECQAAGMPLITTDAAPMNEYRPLDTIPVVGSQVLQLCGNQPIVSHVMQPADLIAVMERWLGADLSDASRRAREFVEHEHSWDAARPMICERLVAY